MHIFMEDKDNEVFAKKIESLNWDDYKNDYNKICKLVTTEKVFEFIKNYVEQPEAEPKPKGAISEPLGTIAIANANAVEGLILTKEELELANQNYKLCVYEGYHLRDFLYFVSYLDGTKRIPELNQVLREALGRNLKGFKSFKAAQDRASSKKPGDNTVSDIMESVANNLDVSLVQCFLGFLQFCQVNRRPLRSHTPKQLDTLITSLKAHIDAVRPRKKTRVKLIYTGDGWLNPYYADGVPFVGRELEQIELNSFVKQPDLFKIWAIEAPSGAGKTRLTIHWLNDTELLNDWNVIWLGVHDKENPSNWAGWTPEKRTIIVLDYMFGFEKCLNNIINSCKEGRGEKVRLLVLDHHFDNRLWTDKRWGLSDTPRHLEDNQKLFYKRYSLKFENDADQNTILTKIIASRANLDEADEKVEVGFKYLITAKGAYHPLFAALIGDAIRCGTNYFSWNRRQLIENYLFDERRPWEEQGTNGQWAACFVSIATVFNGVDIDKLIPKNIDFKYDTPKDFDPVLKICSTLISTDCHDNVTAFAPDLLGESFFLLWLIKLKKIPRLYADFCTLFCLVHEYTSKNNRNSFLAFVERLTNNLLNDNQDDRFTENSWKALREFLEPRNFEKNENMVLTAMFSSANTLHKIEKVASVALKNSLSGFRCNIHMNNIHESLKKQESVDVNLGVSSLDWHLCISTLCFAMDSFLSTGDFAEDTDKSLIEFFKECEISLLIKNHMLPSHFDTPYFFDWIGNQPDVDFNIPDKNGYNALHIACSNNYERVVRRLVEHDSVNLDEYGPDNKTALMIACKQGNLTIVKLLLQCGKPIDLDKATKEFGLTALMFACFNANNDVIRELLDNKKPIDIDKETHKLKYTALIFACCLGNDETVKILLNCGKRIDLYRECEEFNWTALMFACGNGSEYMISALVEKMKNDKINAYEGKYSLLYIALSHNNYDVLPTLCRYFPIINKFEYSRLLAVSEGYSQPSIAQFTKDYEGINYQKQFPPIYDGKWPLCSLSDGVLSEILTSLLESKFNFILFKNGFKSARINTPSFFKSTHIIEFLFDGKCSQQNDSSSKFHSMVFFMKDKLVIPAYSVFWLGNTSAGFTPEDTTLGYASNNAELKNELRLTKDNILQYLKFHNALSHSSSDGKIFNVLPDINISRNIKLEVGEQTWYINNESIQSLLSAVTIEEINNDYTLRNVLIYYDGYLAMFDFFITNIGYVTMKEGTVLASELSTSSDKFFMSLRWLE